ncbi:unnamed protein product, partial [Mesorhabditis spiculigera]
MFTKEPANIGELFLPLYGACNDYVACVPPAECNAGRCACAAGFQPSGPSCVQGPYLMENTAYAPAPVSIATPYYYVAPSAPVATVVAAPAPIQRIHTHDTTYVRVPVPCCLPAAPESETTTEAVMRDQGLTIAYPGEQCNPALCVGGSTCENGTCVCRKGEEIVNRTCVAVEVPLAEDTTAAPTTTESTTVISTTAVQAIFNDAPDSTSTTTTTAASTTVGRTLGCQQPSCNCDNGFYFNGGCQNYQQQSEQVFRINVVVSPGQSCFNSAQCSRGAYCGQQGVCQCAGNYYQMGRQCVRRR